MSAPEQPQGVLLRYAGGEVYALPTADRHVWRVAGVDVFADRVASVAATGEVIGLETDLSLAGAAKRRRIRAREDAKRTGKGRAKR